ncbi:hypothetical protein ACC756_39195, partial [Rhizobium ruizarguesonis]
MGAFVLMQATERRSVAPSADTGRAGDDHGRSASVPEAIPLSGLRDVFWRVFHELLDLVGKKIERARWHEASQFEKV